MYIKMYVQVAFCILGILKLLTNHVLSNSCRHDIPSCISYNRPRYREEFHNLLYILFWTVLHEKGNASKIVSSACTCIHMYTYVRSYIYMQSAVGNKVWNGSLDMNVEMRRILKEAVVICFKALSQQFPGGTGTPIKCLRYERLDR
jgi:hypothetical protein